VGESLTARRVVIATGPFQRTLIPGFARAVPRSVQQLDPTRYRRPEQLPQGAVLVVGSGASGTQIADELVRAGRTVYLSVSRHRRVPRRFRGKDAYWWLETMGRFAQAIDSFPDRRWPPSTLVTGVNGGYDVNVRSLATGGVHVVGRVLAITDGVVATDRSTEPILNEADQDDRLGYRLYLRLRLGEGPVLDQHGRPQQTRGVTRQPGLYFLGLHWMHTFKSFLKERGRSSPSFPSVDLVLGVSDVGCGAPR
jgi:putative flavoprotein involved in K+ transport